MRNLLPIAASLLLFISTPATSQDSSSAAFDFKGLRLGMTHSELNDSLESPTFFLHGMETVITQFHGDTSERIDTLTQEVYFIGEDVSAGCVHIRSSAQCPAFEQARVLLKRGVLVEIRLEQSSVRSFWALTKLIGEGVAAKMGEPFEDNYDTWFGRTGVVDGSRIHDWNAIYTWSRQRDADSVIVDLSFQKVAERLQVRDEHQGKPLFDVRFSARLIDPVLEEWAKGFAPPPQIDSVEIEPRDPGPTRRLEVDF